MHYFETLPVGDQLREGLEGLIDGVFGHDWLEEDIFDYPNSYQYQFLESWMRCTLQV